MAARKKVKVIVVSLLLVVSAGIGGQLMVRQQINPLNDQKLAVATDEG